MAQRMSHRYVGSIDGAPAHATVEFELLPHVGTAHITGRIESHGYRYTFHAEGHPSQSSFVGGMSDRTRGGYNETHIRLDFNENYDFVMTVNPFAHDYGHPPQYVFRRR